MSDLRFVYTPKPAQIGFVDLKQLGGQLASNRDLETAVIISLFTDRLAQTDDQIPDGTKNRRGWWGDSYSANDGDLIGSRLWLLHREKQTAETLARAREYCREALQWLLTDGVAERVNIEAEYVRMGVLGIRVEIFNFAQARTPSRYAFAWDQIANQLLASDDDLVINEPVDLLLTEGGDTLTTEAGDELRTEPS